MHVTDRHIIYEGRYLRIVEKTVITGNGHARRWETVERTNVHGSGAVVIIAVTKDGKLLYEKNWRAGSESYVIQFPAGLTDLHGESEEETARRELLEETGYAATTLIPVLLSPLAADLSRTRAMHYFAPGVEFVGTPSGSDIEGIEVIEVPVNEADEFMLHPPDGAELDLQVPGIVWALRTKRLI